MKNEGPFVLEWLAWQKLMGVDRVLVLSNNCDDGTDRLLDQLDRLGELRHLPNPVALIPGGKPHNIGITYGRGLREWRDADYVFLCDVDEFPVLRDSAATLKDLLRQLDYPDVISMSETIFGTGPVLEYRDLPVTGQFLKSSGQRPGKWKSRRGLKSITRNDPRLVIRNHRPIARENIAKDLNWVNGSGRPFPIELRHIHQKGFDARGSFDLVTLNHYTLRSLESFLVKQARGDAVVPDRIDGTYFRRRNQVAEDNTAMLAHQPKLLAEIERLKALPHIDALHEASVAAHLAKIAALRKTALYQELLHLSGQGAAVPGDA